MTTSTLKNVCFAGMATYIPKHVIPNLAGCKPQLRAEHEHLVRNIGIETRRMAREWQCFSDLAFDAAERLLKNLEWRREEVDALIVVTQSSDCPTPAAAIILQDRLGLPHSVVTFDVNLDCLAYPFTLDLLGSLVAAGRVKKSLVLVDGRGASVNDPIFSDADTATALEFCEDAPPIHFDLNSGGSGYKAIILPVDGHRGPVGVQYLLPFREDENGHRYRAIDLQLDGTAVFSFSTRRVPPVVEKLLDYVGAGKNEMDYSVFHQANRMINETIRKRLGLPVERVPSTLRDLGNTSGASLPVTMTARISREPEAGRNHMLLYGSGIGLSQGACLVDVGGMKFPDLVES